MTKVPHWMLRRFASRAIEILARLGVEEPSLAIYQENLAPSAQAYLGAYQAVAAYELARAKKIKGREAALQVLLRKLRSWTAALANDLGIDRSVYGDRPNVPEEVVNDTVELLAVLDRHEQEAGPMPFYSESLRTDLQTALTAAQAELTAAGGSHVTLAELRAELHTATKAVQADLVAFRRALRAFFGSSHPDYQRLRVPRGSQSLYEEDLPDGASPSEADAADASSVGQEAVELEDDDDDHGETMDQAS